MSLICHHSCPEEEASSKGNIFSGLFPFVLNILKKYRSQLQKETNIGLGETRIAMEDSADSSEVKTSNQRVEGVEVDSEEPLEVSESGDSDREEEPSRNSRLGLGDENIEGTNSKNMVLHCFVYS